MSTVGAYEAKTHLPRLLDEVEQGGSVTITRHGHPVARLVGVRRSAVHEQDAVDAFARARARLRLGTDLKGRIEEGRRGAVSGSTPPWPWHGASPTSRAR
mgnify:CR=1 FL=1